MIAAQGMTDLTTNETTKFGVTGSGITTIRALDWGGGGTVAVLGHEKSGEAIQQIARRYADESGHEGYVFRGSSPGAWNEETVFVIDLFDLEGRAAPITLALCALNVRVVQLALQPAGGAELAPARGFDPHSEIALSASAGTFLSHAAS